MVCCDMGVLLNMILNCFFGGVLLFVIIGLGFVGCNIVGNLVLLNVINVLVDGFVSIVLGLEEEFIINVGWWVYFDKGFLMVFSEV